MLSTDHENTLMCLLLKKIKFSKFYHVSDQTRFLRVILSDFDQVLCDLKVSKSEIDLWGIPHWGIQCFRAQHVEIRLCTVTKVSPVSGALVLLKKNLKIFLTTFRNFH